MLSTEDCATAQAERQHADDDDEHVERGAQRRVDPEVRLKLHVALAKESRRLRFKRQNHLTIVIRVIEQNDDVEPIAIWCRDRSARLQIHRLDGKLDRRLHQSGKLNVNVFLVEKRLDAFARVILLQRLARRVDLRIKHVTLVESEYDAFLILI